MQRKIATPSPLRALVAAEAGAAFVIDVRHASLVAANDAAITMWAGAGASLRLPMTLDRAMPALSSLAALTMTAQPRPRPKSLKASPLIFWTPRGVWTAEVLVRPVDRSGHPGCVLIVAPGIGPKPTVAMTAAEPSEPPAAKPQAPLPDATDLATLARIRAAIEAGGADRPVACAEPEALFEAARARVAAEAGNQEHAPDLQAAGLARVAHEVRTPLAAIAALADVMRQEHFGPIRNARYKEYISDIHDSARHALDVVTGMLDPSAWSTGRPALNPARLQINPIVAASLSSMGPLAEASGLSLVGKLTPRLPAVHLDAGSLRQMLLNLIANAIQYAGTGATITVATSRRKNGPVSLEVRDNGGGMAAAKIARILGPPDKSLPAAGDRRGLGLPFTRLLAEANGATLTLSARHGRGTRAAILIPAAPRQPSLPAQAKPPRQSRPKSSRRS